MAEYHSHTNRLIFEKSPYLLQHAHNPVDWHPWGDDAFMKAKNEDKPIFLSIGYATCHWCHIMEKESFENDEVAKLLNALFINIKVDREELPEVDKLYMDFAQAMMSSSAGWPLNVILTPQLYPFFATTYLPPKAIAGRPGMVEFISHIKEIWLGSGREDVLSQARQIVDLFQNSVVVKGSEVPGQMYAPLAVDHLLQVFDIAFGGMKGAPKFPTGYQYSFLIHYSYLEKDSRSMYMVEKTLEMMYRGGIYDHLGGGFSRYSVDEQWLIPHFEKMLYDNAILGQCYCDAWLVTNRSIYQRVCKEIIDYVLNHLLDSEGGFYSAEDADSEGKEGKFYAWTIDEIENVLGEEDAELFCTVYGVTSIGNFEGKNILHLPSKFEEYVSDHGLNFSEFEIKIDALRQSLFNEREKRVHPMKDDKVLSSWNGLMIHTCVEAGKVFNQPQYLEAGKKAAQFIYDKLWINDRLFRRYREGESDFRASLDEYAFMIRATLTLFEAGCGTRWLSWALEMERILRNEFKVEGGAFYQTNGNDPNLILRQCTFADGAEPSGNAIHCENLLRLYLLTHNPVYKHQAEDVLKAVKGYLNKYSPGYSFHFRNLLRYHQQRSPTIIVALNSNRDGMYEIERILFEKYLPHRSIIWRHENDAEIFELIPGVKGQPPVGDRTTVYICHDRVCEKPLVEFDEIQTAIEKLL